MTPEQKKAVGYTTELSQGSIDFLRTLADCERHNNAQLSLLAVRWLEVRRLFMRANAQIFEAIPTLATPEMIEKWHELRRDFHV